MKSLPIAAVTLALAMSAPALAKQGHKGHGHDKGQEKGEGHGEGRFGGDERGEIQGWYAAHPEDRDALPPGLARKGKVPPGWQKAFAAGQRVPDDAWELRVPVPSDVIVKLPVPPPPGVVLVKIGSQILKVREKTHEVLDRIGLPHPP